MRDPETMKFAVNLPNFGSFSDPGLVVDLAITAETAGWDGFFVWDHIVVADGMPVADPWTVLAAVGRATQRLAIGPMVTPLPRRRPWVVARQAATLDRLTGTGRLVLGVGLGFPPEEEFGTFGEPTAPEVRAEMLDEALAVMAGMWSGETFAFHGRHYTVKESRFAPAGRIPIWVAGMWPHRRPFRRAGRHDGVFPMRADMADLTPDDVADVVAYVVRHRDRSGSFDVSVVGPPDAATAAAHAAAGATWYHVGPPPGGQSEEESRAWIAAGPPRTA